MIGHSLEVFKQSILSLVYLSIALYLAPLVTIGTLLILGSITVFFRFFLEGGYSLGDAMAEAKERIQTHAQAGTQGIRDVKLFGLSDEISSQFNEAVREAEETRIQLIMNRAAINNFYQLLTALTVFILIYMLSPFRPYPWGRWGFIYLRCFA